MESCNYRSTHVRKAIEPSKFCMSTIYGHISLSLDSHLINLSIQLREEPGKERFSAHLRHKLVYISYFHKFLDIPLVKVVGFEKNTIL